MNQPLTGKSILITGGTSRLGLSFVDKALAAGGRVYLTYFEHGDEAARLEKRGATAYRLDLSDGKAVNRFSQSFCADPGSLDVLIHNAAAVRDHMIQNMPDEDWDYVLAVNLKAPYVLTKGLLPCLVRGSRGSKVFMITSRLALRGGIGVSNYAASKAGLIGLVKTLAKELGPQGILVNALNPGFMQSRMTENLPEAVIQQMKEASPLGRVSDPDEVADFLVYLCSERMTQVSGQVFHVDSREII